MSSELLLPYEPGSADPFDRRKAAHLLRRSGFGAAPEAIDKALAQGLEATVEGLFDEAKEEEEAYQRTFAAINGRLVDFSDAGAVRNWWLYRMQTTRAPLREKLALFWHGHFATSVAKVDDAALMHRQIETFRRHAWGNVRDLVLAVARDPAMIVWLDSETNTKEHPNENFARELMELFTCGIGHYTEKDVREAARAFTGWHREGAEFAFDAEAHDFDRKQFLGKSGRFDGTDIIEILMQQPATTRFLARKLLRFFAAPEPSAPVIDEAAALLERTRLNVKWFLRDLFLSRYFFSTACFRARLSSPVEFVLGTVRTLNVRMPAEELVGPLDAMGQSLLAPPNVKGWDGETKWINSNTWAARLRFADQIAHLEDGGDLGTHFDLERLVPPAIKEPQKVIGRLVDVLFQGDLADNARRALASRLVQPDGDSKETQSEAFRDDPDFRRDRIRAVVEVLLSLPEYHAC